MSRLFSAETLRRIDAAIPSIVWSVTIPAVVAFAMFTLFQLIPRPPLTSVVRGFRPPGTQAGFALRPSRVLGDGSLALRWRRVAPADAYRLDLYNSELDELARFVALPDTYCVVRPPDLVEKLTTGQVLVYRVRAIKDGLELARSEVGTCRVP